MSNASYAFGKSNFEGFQARREDKSLGFWGLDAGVRKDARRRVHKVVRAEGKQLLASDLVGLANDQWTDQIERQAMPDLTKGRAYSTDSDQEMAVMFSNDPHAFFEMMELQALAEQVKDAEEQSVSAQHNDLLEVMGCDVPADFGWDAMAQLSLEADARGKRARKAFQAHRDDDGEEMDY